MFAAQFTDKQKHTVSPENSAIVSMHLVNGIKSISNPLRDMKTTRQFSFLLLFMKHLNELIKDGAGQQSLQRTRSSSCCCFSERVRTGIQGTYRSRSEQLRRVRLQLVTVVLHV